MQTRIIVEGNIFWKKSLEKFTPKETLKWLHKIHDEFLTLHMNNLTFLSFLSQPFPYFLVPLLLKTMLTPNSHI